MKSRPPVVGITGGIGSGKTTVCKVFEVLGAITYYADDRAKELMEQDTGVIASIKGLFGEQAYKECKLDRVYIAHKVFTDNGLLEKLNAIVHPAVAKDFELWIHQNQDASLLLKEAALIFETDSHQALDKTVLVMAPVQLRIRRVMHRDPHRTEKDVKDIIASQMSDDEKLNLADYIIKNDGTISVIRQVMTIVNDLT